MARSTRSAAACSARRTGAAPASDRRAIGGRVNTPAQLFDDVLYLNHQPDQQDQNYGFSGQIDYEMGEMTLTSITAWRKSRRLQFRHRLHQRRPAQRREHQRRGPHTFTQELRLTGEFRRPGEPAGRRFLFQRESAPDRRPRLGPQCARLCRFAGARAEQQALSIPAAEVTFGTLTGNPARYVGQFFAAGQSLAERDTLKNQSYSLFGQADFEVTDRLTLTGGLSYTNDRKRYSVNVTTNDVFASLNIPALRATATSAGIAQTVGPHPGVAHASRRRSGLSRPPSRPPSRDPGRRGGGHRTAAGAARAAVPAADPRHSQRGRAGQDLGRQADLHRARPMTSTTAQRLSELCDRLQGEFGQPVARQPAARERSLRDPDGRDRVPNQEFGTRFAGPENSTVYEAGLKGSWDRHRSTSRCSIRRSRASSRTSSPAPASCCQRGQAIGLGHRVRSGQAPGEAAELGLAMTFLHPKYDDFSNRHSATSPASGLGHSRLFRDFQRRLRS